MIQDREVRHDHAELPSARNSSAKDLEGSGVASVSEHQAEAALALVKKM